ncbi:MAG: ABC transporter ATP-binding protein [Phycisphaeraceae bacterium]
MTQVQSKTSDARQAPGDPVVACAGLTKTFRDFWMRSRVRAVDSIDLEVRRGEVFGLLGPNGSGKSTTIKMILGLLHPTAGRIAVFGKHPRDVATKQEIGYLPEESYLYRFLNARETLQYYARLFHQNRRQRQQRIDMLLEMVGLDKVATRPIGEYSKGMQRRIGLAQALINDPQLLILDEPTTGLDPIGTRQIKDLILELSRRGKTILLCSHLLADVEDVCDRVSIMFGGKIRRAGTVDDLLVQEGRTTIHLPQLDDADLAAIEKLLQSRGKPIERVDQPRQKLETLFLEIVRAAQAEGALTSGASSGGRIAEFLAAESEQAPEEGEALIDRLTSADEPHAARDEAAPTAPPAEEAQRELPREDEVIDELIAGNEPEPEPTREESGSPRPDEAAPGDGPSRSADQEQEQDQDQEQVDEDLLDSLLGQQDEDDAKGERKDTQ